MGFVVSGLALGLITFSVTSLAPSSPYTYKRPSFDGTGKVYMGREIAQVMGYQGSEWLERKDRAQEEEPQKLIEACLDFLKTLENKLNEEKKTLENFVLFKVYNEKVNIKKILLNKQSKHIDLKFLFKYYFNINNF